MHWSRRGAWSVAVLAQFVLLADAVTAHDPFPLPLSSDSVPSLRSWLDAALGHPSVSIALAGALTISIVYGLRRIALLRQAWRPGPVLVSLQSPGVAAPTAELAVYFRDRLSQLKMFGSSPVPGGLQPTDFVDVLRTARVQPSRPVQAVGEILRVICPRHAYEVHATLLRRSDAPECGVAIEILMLPGREASSVIFWEASWKRAIECAARRAAGEILPQTRQCRHTVWRAWQGVPLPERLLDYYDDAQTYRAERRYDDALRAYHDALELDTHNPAIRVELGQLQEKLGMFLDALVTYEPLLLSTSLRQKV